MFALYWFAARFDSDESPDECAALGSCCGRRRSGLAVHFAVAAEKDSEIVAVDSWLARAAVVASVESDSPHAAGVAVSQR